MPSICPFLLAPTTVLPSLQYRAPNGGSWVECCVHSLLELLTKVLEKFRDRVARSTRQRAANMNDHSDSTALVDEQ